jgi:hypothetical protein
MNTWSKMILDLHREGYTPDEIQVRIALPIVTREYIDQVLRLNKSFVKRRHQYVVHQKRVPAEGTIARKVYDKVQELGGNDAFMNERKKYSYTQLATLWDVPPVAIQNYYQVFIKEKLYCTKVHNELVSKIPVRKKKVTIKEARNLW